TGHPDPRPAGHRLPRHDRMLVRPILGAVWVRILEKTRQQHSGYCRPQKVRAYPPISSYSAVVNVALLAPYLAAITCRAIVRSALPAKFLALRDVIVRRVISEHIPRRFIWIAS